MSKRNYRIDEPERRSTFGRPFRILLLCLAGGATVFSAEASFVDLHERALSAYRHNYLHDSETLFRAAQSKLVDPGSSTAASLWNELGRVHQAQGEYDDARKDYRRALEIGAALTPPDAILKAVTLNNLGQLAMASGNLTEAKRVLEDSINTLKSGSTMNDPITVTAMSNLGVTLDRMQAHDEAAQAFQRAMNVARGLGPAGELSYAFVLSDAGLHNLRAGDYLEAISQERAAIAIEARHSETTVSQIGDAYEDLAAALIAIERYSDAEEVLTRALELYRTAEPDQTKVELLNMIALVRSRTNRLAAAAENIGSALELARQLRVNDALLSRLHNTSATIAELGGQRKEARHELEQAVDLSGHKGDDYIEALTSIAKLEAEQRHDRKAADLYATILNEDESSLGTEHAKTAADLGNLASQMFALKHRSEALALYVRAVRIQEKRFGADSLPVARTWFNIGTVQSALHRDEEARAALQRSANSFQAAGLQTQEYIACLREYAALLRRDRLFAEAEQADLEATHIEVRRAITAENRSVNAPVPETATATASFQ